MEDPIDRCFDPFTVPQQLKLSLRKFFENSSFHYFRIESVFGKRQEADFIPITGSKTTVHPSHEVLVILALLEHHALKEYAIPPLGPVTNKKKNQSISWLITFTYFDIALHGVGGEEVVVMNEKGFAFRMHRKQSPVLTLLYWVWATSSVGSTEAAGGADQLKIGECTSDFAGLESSRPCRKWSVLMRLVIFLLRTLRHWNRVIRNLSTQRMEGKGVASHNLVS